MSKATMENIIGEIQAEIDRLGIGRGSGYVVALASDTADENDAVPDNWVDLYDDVSHNYGRGEDILDAIRSIPAYTKPELPPRIEDEGQRDQERDAIEQNAMQRVCDDLAHALSVFPGSIEQRDRTPSRSNTVETKQVDYGYDEPRVRTSREVITTDLCDFMDERKWSELPFDERVQGMELLDLVHQGECVLADLYPAHLDRIREHLRATGIEGILSENDKITDDATEWDAIEKVYRTFLHAVHATR